MSVNERQTVEAASGFINGPSADHASDLIQCAYHGVSHLHPPSYNNDVPALVKKCIDTFTGQLHTPMWPKELQKKALERWNKFHDHRLDLTQWNEGLDLHSLVDIFTDTFFCIPGRELKHHIDVQWTDSNPPSSSSSCHQPKATPPTTPRDKYPRALITIPIPLTAPTAQRTFNALLHALAHAYLLVFACTCTSCACVVTRAQTVGVTGHGPEWVRLCRALEAEAEKRFGGLGWDLDCADETGCVRGEGRRRERFESGVLARVEVGRRAGRW